MSLRTEILVDLLLQDIGQGCCKFSAPMPGGDLNDTLNALLTAQSLGLVFLETGSGGYYKLTNEGKERLALLCPPCEKKS